MLQTKWLYQNINDRYLLTRLIGQGGMGVVYEAQDRLTQETIALKIINQTNAFYDPSDSKSLYASRMTITQEFKILAALRHPNIISVLDYGIHQTLPYFTMELLQKATDLRTTAVNLPLREKIKYLMQLLQALLYLHRHQVVHRDLKSSNIVVTPQGVVKLLDFGLALPSQQTSGMAGSLAYMSPEVLREEPVTELTDLYGFGVIFYELVCGRLPFLANTVNEMMEQILNTPPDFTPIAALAPPAIITIIKRLLAKNPADRYPDVTSVLTDLATASGISLPVETISIRESFLRAAPFVGRKGEFQRLDHALTQLLNQHGSAWLVGGEAGVGKSRLIEEIRIRALVRGVSVLRGQAVEIGGLPYQVWRSVAPSLVLSTPITQTEAAILKSFIPNIDKLRGIVSPDTYAVDHKDDQSRLAQTLVDLLRRISQPTLLILEDLHWERDGLAVIQQITETINEYPIMVIGSYRSDEFPLFYGKFPHMRQIQLERFAKPEIETLSQYMLGATSESFIKFLTEQTEGNAYYMVEVLQVLARRSGQLGTISTLSELANIYEGGIQTLIQRRVKQLPLDDQPILRLAAVIGRDLDFTLLQAVDNEFDLNTWLLRCADFGILGVNNKQWRFTHDKLRDGILEVLATSERVRLNRLAAETIEAVYPNNPTYASRLLHHWREVGDLDKQVEYLMLLSKQMDSLASNYEQLSQHLLDVLFKLPEHPTDDATRIQRAWLLTYLGQALIRLGEYAAAQTQFAQSLRLIANMPDQPALQLAVYQGLSESARELHQFDEAKFNAERALALTQQQDEIAVVAVLRNLAITEFWLGNLSAAQQHLETVLTRSRAQDYPYGIAHGLNGLGNVALYQGDLPQAVEHYQACLEIARQMGHHSLVASVLANLGLAYTYLHKHEQAAAYFEECIQLARNTGLKHTLSNVLASLASLRYAQGDYMAAKRHAQETLTLARQQNTPHNLLVSLLTLVSIYLKLDALEAALEIIREIVTLEAVHQSERELILTVQTLARLLIYVDDIPAATAICIQILHLETPDPSVSGLLGELITLIEAGLNGKTLNELRAETPKQDLAVVYHETVKLLHVKGLMQPKASTPTPPSATASATV